MLKNHEKYRALLFLLLPGCKKMLLLQPATPLIAGFLRHQGV